MTTLSPTAEPMSLGIGIPQSGESGCILNQVVTAAPQADPLLRVNVDAGLFCVKLSSTGATPSDVSFSATLVHP
jgi:hypothetical protein